MALDLKSTLTRTMKRMTISIALLLLLQTANPQSDELRQVYAETKNNILKSAEKMPEENYGFRPAPRVRTYGEILGHIAQEQYLFFCGPARGENKAVDIEKTKTTKAEIVTALKESFAYCDVAYGALTDTNGTETLQPSKHTRLSVLWMNLIHDNLHYGNLVTYMRMKGLVPPSTEGQ